MGETKTYAKTQKTITVSVRPPKVTLSSVKNSTDRHGKEIIVKWKKVKGVTGYEVEYCTNIKDSSHDTRTVTGQSTTSTTFTLNSLYSGMRYYFRVRAYKKSNGKMVYGAWSSRTYAATIYEYWIGDRTHLFAGDSSPQFTVKRFEYGYTTKGKQKTFMDKTVHATYKISNSSVTSVSSSGVVYAKKAGHTKLTITTKYNTFKIDIYVSPSRSQMKEEAIKEFKLHVPKPSSVEVNSVKFWDYGTGLDIDCSYRNGYGGWSRSTMSYYYSEGMAYYKFY